MANTRVLRAVALVALLGLLVLCLAWELWLAPLRPGGSYRTYQWSSMFVLAYLAEGLVRTATERGTSQSLAAIEIALSAAFFVSVVAYARLTRASA